MTKQEAVQKVQAEVKRLFQNAEESIDDNTRFTYLGMAERLQWAISIFQQVEVKED